MALLKRSRSSASLPERQGRSEDRESDARETLSNAPSSVAEGASSTALHETTDHAGAVKSVAAASPPVSAPYVARDPGVQYRRVRHAFGLDISDRSVKAAECVRTKRGIVLQAVSHREVPEGVIAQGEVRQPDTLANVIRAVLKEAVPRPITTRHVVVSIGGEKAYLHPFEFPPTLTETQVRRAIPYEAEAVLPILLRDMYTDMQFHRSRDRSHHVLFAAASRALVDPYVDVLIQAGLLPVVLDNESLAVARALVPVQEDPVLIVDFGGDATTITTVERGMAHGAVNMALGGIQLTRMLAATLGIPEAEAETRKREQGLTGLSEEGRRVLLDTLAPLSAEVKKAATYHQTHTGRLVQSILLTGGGR